MTVSLTPEMERIVSQQVDAGKYASAGEVVDKALRLFAEQESSLAGTAEIQSQIAVGLEQLASGKYRDYDADGLKDLFSRIKAQGALQLREGQKG